MIDSVLRRRISWKARVLAMGRSSLTGLALAVILSGLPAFSSVAQTANTLPWWKGAVVYEVLPRSFQDSDGNGIGDLSGIESRLGYLADLGIDAIWLTPFYPSPQVDFGYDISNYVDVDPLYGTLADFDRLVSSAPRSNIRVIVDLVLPHSSTEHPWFLESAKARTGPKSDWYVWADGRRGSDGATLPPNNWQSLLGGSAWAWQSSRQQFYYHQYYAQQPNLNWRNPEVRSAMKDVARFWLKHGVSGFRIDSIPDLLEDPLLRDEPHLGHLNLFRKIDLDLKYTYNLPAIHPIIRDYREYVSRINPDAVLLGETAVATTKELDAFYGGARHDELQLPIDFLVGMGDIGSKPVGSDKLNIPRIRKRLIEAYTQLHGGEPVFVTDTHDGPRSRDRYADGVHDLAIAKALAAVLLTVKGAVILYQGQEIGQITSPPARIEDVKDPVGKAGWPTEKGRDGERTPMQWTSARPNAGFTPAGSTPWLPIPASSETVNVESELRDAGSLLSWYRSLLRLRKEDPALRDGAIRILDWNNPHVLCFLRFSEGAPPDLIIINGSIEPQTVIPNLRGILGARRRLVPILSSVPAPQIFSTSGPLHIAPLAAIVVRIDGAVLKAKW
jgi:alpha-glucosidase